MLKRVLLRESNFLAKNARNFSSISEPKVEKEEKPRKKIKGWVRSLRKMKNLVFVDVYDGITDSHTQVVVNKNRCPNEVNVGCSVVAEGELAMAPNGKPELQADEFTLFGKCDLDKYPFLPRKIYSPEYVRQYLHLRPKTRTFSSTFRLRNRISTLIREHFESRGFTHVDTPILSSNDCEGAGEVFFVQPSNKELIKEMKGDKKESDDEVYFGNKTYLSVSGQLHLEVLARALSKVYNFAPTFRAENSKSRLHLSEFYMIEVEMAFVDNIRELADEAESLLKSVAVNMFSERCSDMSEDLRTLSVTRPHWIDKDFGFITYDEAIQILTENADKISVPVRYGCNFSKEHELFLVERNNGVPTFVVDWPKSTKPFYMKESSEDNNKVVALDLLAPMVGEIIGGSVREDDVSKLEAKIPKTSDLDWYLEIRKFGNVPTAGFGMGFERFLQLLLGVPSIKDVIPFPRWPHNCKF